jgi:hypothetical protein
MEMQKGDEFMTGFLGSIVNQQEENKKNNTLNPEMRLKLLDMQSEGKIQKAPYANNPQGAMQLIAQKMKESFGGGPDPLSQYQATPQNPGFADAFRAKLDAAKDLDPNVKQAALGTANKIRTQQDLQTALLNFLPKTRAGAYFEKGMHPDTGQLLFTNIAEPGLFDSSGNKVEIEEKRLIPLKGQNLGEKAAKDFADLETEKKQFQYATQLYKPEYVGPIKGTVKQTIDFWLNSDNPERATFYTVTQNAMINRLKRISGGAVTPEEAERFTDAFFNKTKSPQAFEAALDFYMNSNDSEAYNYAKTLMKAGYVGTPDKKPGDLTKKNVPQGVNANPSQTEPSATTPKINPKFLKSK